MQHVWGAARNLLDASHRGDLVRALKAHVGSKEDLNSEIGEIGAWKHSVPALLELLVNAGLGHVHVILEHRLPYSPQRVDAILCGLNPVSGESSYVLIELKRWSTMQVDEYGLVQIPGRRQPDLHPSEQVRRYCQHLIDFNPFLARRPKMVRGIAYLHNFSSAVSEVTDFNPDDFGRSYTGAQEVDFVDELKSLLGGSPEDVDASKAVAVKLISAEFKPARTLLDTAADVLAGRGNYVLLDAQQVAYELVRRAVVDRNQVAQENRFQPKKVIIVHGGPGSGKSVIAISLLSSLIQHRRSSAHATGSKAFTETLREKLAESNVRVKRIFTYFNAFETVRNDSLEVLVCDEAHRVRGNSSAPRDQKEAFGQIGQLIDAAKVPVFLLDTNQVVRPREIGTPADIVDVAKAKGCIVEEIHLDGQFRCGGSPYYDEWVLRLLGLAEGGQPIAWSDLVADTDDQFVVDSVSSPQLLESWLQRQMSNFGGTARIAAGFCWTWSFPAKKNGVLRLVDDVQINEWARPWNAKHDHPVPGVPSASLWATDSKGFDQIGCIYTAQGFEYAWAGVIFGPDLVVRDGRWVAQSEYSEDGPVKKANPKTFDRLVRNTYKVLMTRGMRGVCLYSTDDETRVFFEKYAR